MHSAGRFVSFAERAKARLAELHQPRQWMVWTAFVVMGVLAGCSSTTHKAPITDLSVEQETPSVHVPEPTGKTYTVQRGDTLYKIATAHNVPVQQVAQANDITDPSQLRVGQTLKIPGATEVAAQTDISSASQVVASPVEVSPKKDEPKPEEKPVAQPDKKPAESSAAPRASDANLIDWGWPGQGKVIQDFTPSTKDIDIEGHVGDPVVAAAAGKVMYSGNGVRGLGNLILLGHSDGFITAYAHNDSLLVKTGEEVKKGQRIATLGQSEADSPRLHFEIRRRGTPVNPISYLPKR